MAAEQGESSFEGLIGVEAGDGVAGVVGGGFGAPAAGTAPDEVVAGEAGGGLHGIFDAP